RRRIFGLVAVLAIAWGALWPLVSAARPVAPRIPNFVCSQAGFHVEGPQPADEEADAKFHCSLCVTPVDVTPPVVVTPSFAFEPLPPAPPAQPPLALFHFFAARSPPSRAPPHFS